MALTGAKALVHWCQQVTNGYKDVNIKNMTSSWRDGLGFCAILHHYRPDLINFEKLAKENIAENNELAFTVAENELGIAALLDVEDMVEMEIPDKLSILTYISQYYQYFRDKVPGEIPPPLRQPSKRQATHSSTEVPKKKSPATTPGVSAAKEVIGASPTPKINKSTMDRFCARCRDMVYLMERLQVEGRLFHRACFRCFTCDTQLRMGTYRYIPAEDQFYCDQHYRVRTTSPTSDESRPSQWNGSQQTEQDVLHSLFKTLENKRKSKEKSNDLHTTGSVHTRIEEARKKFQKAESMETETAEKRSSSQGGMKDVEQEKERTRQPPSRPLSPPNLGNGKDVKSNNSPNVSGVQKRSNEIKPAEGQSTVNIPPRPSSSPPVNKLHASSDDLPANDKSRGSYVDNLENAHRETEQKKKPKESVPSRPLNLPKVPQNDENNQSLSNSDSKDAAGAVDSEVCVSKVVDEEVHIYKAPFQINTSQQHEEGLDNPRYGEKLEITPSPIYQNEGSSLLSLVRMPPADEVLDEEKNLDIVCQDISRPKSDSVLFASEGGKKKKMVFKVKKKKKKDLETEDNRDSIDFDREKEVNIENDETEDIDEEAKSEDCSKVCIMDIDEQKEQNIKDKNDKISEIGTESVIASNGLKDDTAKLIKDESDDQVNVDGENCQGSIGDSKVIDETCMNTKRDMEVDPLKGEITLETGQVPDKSLEDDIVKSRENAEITNEPSNEPSERDSESLSKLEAEFDIDCEPTEAIKSKDPDISQKSEEIKAPDQTATENVGLSGGKTTLVKENEAKNEPSDKNDLESLGTLGERKEVERDLSEEIDAEGLNESGENECKHCLPEKTDAENFISSGENLSNSSSGEQCKTEGDMVTDEAEKSVDDNDEEGEVKKKEGEVKKMKVLKYVNPFEESDDEILSDPDNKPAEKAYYNPFLSSDEDVNSEPAKELLTNDKDESEEQLSSNPIRIRPGTGPKIPVSTLVRKQHQQTISDLKKNLKKENKYKNPFEDSDDDILDEPRVDTGDSAKEAKHQKKLVLKVKKHKRPAPPRPEKLALKESERVESEIESNKETSEPKDMPEPKDVSETILNQPEEIDASLLKDERLITFKNYVENVNIEMNKEKRLDERKFSRERSSGMVSPVSASCPSFLAETDDFGRLKTEGERRGSSEAVNDRQQALNDYSGRIYKEDVGYLATQKESTNPDESKKQELSKKEQDRLMALKKKEAAPKRPAPPIPKGVQPFRETQDTQQSPRIRRDVIEATKKGVSPPASKDIQPNGDKTGMQPTAGNKKNNLEAKKSAEPVDQKRAVKKEKELKKKLISEAKLNEETEKPKKSKEKPQKTKKKLKVKSPKTKKNSDCKDNEVEVRNETKEPEPYFVDEKEMTLEEIGDELKTIESKQRELERRGVQMEKKLREHLHGEPEENYMITWFDLVREKNKILRRENELIYMSQEIEYHNNQKRIEYELRLLMEKDESTKTEEDRLAEEQLLAQLVNYVSRRNKIVEKMEEDRLREREEDEQIQMVMRARGMSNAKGKKKKAGKKNSATSTFYE